MTLATSKEMLIVSNVPKNVPKIIEVELTHMEAWVVLRALAAYDARDEQAPGAKTWIAERILKLVTPVEQPPTPPVQTQQRTKT